jgi:Conjugative transposon protein TcpC
VNTGATVGDRVRVFRRSARADRLRARTPRYLFIAFLAVMSLAGLRSIVRPASPPAPTPAPAHGTDQGAESFALEFARAYLTWGPGVDRGRALRPYLSADLDYEAGLATRGSDRVEWDQVTSDEPAPGGGRKVIVAAGVSSEPVPLYLEVPVERARTGALALTGYPALVGAPSTAHAAVPERDDVVRAPVLALARRVVANYLAANRTNLAADLAPGARVSLPAFRLRLHSIDGVQWAAGGGSGAVFVTAEASDAKRRRWTLTYELGIAHPRSPRPTCTYVETAPADAWDRVKGGPR